MSRLTIELPDALHNELMQLALDGNISVDQYITSAVVEKMRFLKSIDVLKARGKEANLAELRKILDQVPSVPPEDHDAL